MFCNTKIYVLRGCMNKSIVKIMKILVKQILFFVSFFIPKNKNLWLFGAWGGKCYGDNTKHIFEYANSLNEINAIWVSKDEITVNMLRDKGYTAYSYNSFKGIATAMRASIVFVTEGHHDVNAYCCARAIFINTWHGIPMKKILNDNENEKKLSKIKLWILNNIVRYECISQKRDYLMPTSELFINIFESAFLINRDHMIINGYPRNDIYYTDNQSRLVNEIRQKHKDSNVRVVAYLPTHRNYGMNSYDNPMKDIETLNDKLKRNNIILIYKPHFHELKNLKISEPMTNIVIPKCYEDIYDVNLFLSQCDLLVTDYSGAYFDYLLSGKPVVFFCYDIEWYLSNEREMYFEYSDIAKGPKAKTWDEVIQSINEIIKEDEYVNERNNVCDKIFKYRDGNSARRAYEYAKRLTE